MPDTMPHTKTMRTPSGDSLPLWPINVIVANETVRDLAYYKDLLLKARTSIIENPQHFSLTDWIQYFPAMPSNYVGGDHHDVCGTVRCISGWMCTHVAGDHVGAAPCMRESIKRDLGAGWDSRFGNLFLGDWHEFKFRIRGSAFDATPEQAAQAIDAFIDYYNL